jgi:hypothetical protein
MLSTTFNNISIISWPTILLVEETRENHRPVARAVNHVTCHIMHNNTVEMSYFDILMVT